MPLRSIAAIAILIFSFFLILRKPYWGVIIFSAISFIRFQDIIWGIGDLRIALIIAIVTLIAFILNPSQKEIKIKSSTLKWMILFFIATLFSSLFVLVSPDVSYNKNIEFLKIVIYCYLMLNLLGSPSKLNGFIWAIIISMSLIVVWGFQQHFLGNDRLEGIAGLYNSNEFGAILVLYTPLVYIKIFSNKKYEKIFGIVFTCLFISDIIFTQSRAAFLGMLLIISLSFFRAKNKISAIVILLIISLVIGFYGTESYWNRIKTIHNYQGDRSAEGRVALWKAGLDLFKKYPLFGIGQGNFPFMTHYYDLPYGKDMHNTYITILAEGGIVSAIPFIFILLTTFIQLHKVRKRCPEFISDLPVHGIAKAVEAGLAGFLLCGFFNTFHYFEVLYWYCMIPSILLGICQHYCEKETYAEEMILNKNIPFNVCWNKN